MECVQYFSLDQTFDMHFTKLICSTSTHNVDLGLLLYYVTSEHYTPFSLFTPFSPST